MAKKNKPDLSRLIRQERMVEVRAMRMERYRDYNRANEQAEAPIEGETGDPITDLLFKIYEEVKEISQFLKGDKKGNKKNSVKKVISGAFMGLRARAANASRRVLAMATPVSRLSRQEALTARREKVKEANAERVSAQRTSFDNKREQPKVTNSQAVSLPSETSGPGILETIMMAGAAIIAFMQGDKLASLIGDIFNGIFKALGMEDFGQFISDVFDNISTGIRVTKDFIVDAYGHLEEYGEMFMRGARQVKDWALKIWDWIKNSTLAKAVTAVAEGAVGGIKMVAGWVAKKTGLVEEKKEAPELKPYTRDIPLPNAVKEEKEKKKEEAKPVVKPAVTQAAPAPAAPIATAVPETKEPITPRISKTDTVSLFREELAKVGISDKQAQANILAQVQAESGFKPRSEEVGKYSAKWLFGTFPKTANRPWGFESLEEAEKVKQQGAEAVGNRIYGGRMGNKANEGYKYLGRGFIQITGKDNYEKFGKLIGEDLVGSPERANDPRVALKIAAAYFAVKMKKGVDLRDINAVTKSVGPANMESAVATRTKYAQGFMEETPATMVAQAPSDGQDLDRQSQSVQGKKRRPQNVTVAVVKVDNSQTVMG